MKAGPTILLCAVCIILGASITLVCKSEPEAILVNGPALSQQVVGCDKKDPKQFLQIEGYECVGLREYRKIADPNDSLEALSVPMIPEWTTKYGDGPQSRRDYHIWALLQAAKKTERRLELLGKEK